MAPFPWFAVRKTFASGREGPRQDLASTAPELRFEPFQVGVEDFLETMPGCVGPRRSEVLERLDSPTPTFLVVPEIQVGPPADLFPRHTTADLHCPEWGQPYSSLTIRPFRGSRPPLRFRWKPLLRARPWSGALDVLLVTLDPETDEICALLASAGHHVIETILQRRDRPDPRTFVGRGKLDELRERVEAVGVKVVVFNGELRPTMHHLLERELRVECYDRLRVLLELFAQRAWTRDGKLQVELALLQYEVPLLREWIHEADIGERPGFMAGGEQRVDAYYETVKRRIKKIRDELERIRREREVRRTLRKDRGYHLVALAGYANAGKTSLLNALTDEHLLVDDRMFSTLATTTRSLAGTRKRILLTDTIGFVDGVPFWMVEAFHATLEEILQADLVLLLVDGTDSESEMQRKVRLAARTLFPKVPADSILPVLTKIDQVAEDRIEDRRKVLADSEFHRSPLAISVQDGRGLAALRETIQARFAYPIETHLVLAVDAETPGKMHWLYEHTDVVTAVHHADRIELVLRCRPRDRALVERMGRVALSRQLD